MVEEKLEPCVVGDMVPAVDTEAVPVRANTGIVEPLCDLYADGYAISHYFMVWALKHWFDCPSEEKAKGLIRKAREEGKIVRVKRGKYIATPKLDKQKNPLLPGMAVAVLREYQHLRYKELIWKISEVFGISYSMARGWVDKARETGAIVKADGRYGEYTVNPDSQFPPYLMDSSKS